MTDRPTPWRVDTETYDMAVVVDAEDKIVPIHKERGRIVAAVNAVEAVENEPFDESKAVDLDDCARFVEADNLVTELGGLGKVQAAVKLIESCGGPEVIESWRADCINFHHDEACGFAHSGPTCDARGYPADGCCDGCLARRLLKIDAANGGGE